MKYEIDKEFSFCYGHRVHNQTLNSKFSDGLCKCRHLHGHNGKLKIGLSSGVLENGMVTDFKHLDFIKEIVDDVFDHKFIVDINDPLFDDLFNNTKQHLIFSDLHGIQIGRVSKAAIDRLSSGNPAIREKLEGVVVVNFVPTSEKLCTMFGEMASNALQGLQLQHARVSYVEFWETEKSHCKVTL